MLIALDVIIDDVTWADVDGKIVSMPSRSVESNACWYQENLEVDFSRHCYLPCPAPF
jgi:hypothetical protein